MKLIRQANLALEEGTPHQIYEVDLCEVGVGQFVVNFRYGPRGKELRDGTKTAAPVDEETADTIFDDLVASKMTNGYSLVSAASLATPTPVGATPASSDVSADTPQVSDPVAQAVLNRIAVGRPPSKWKLSRAVWRAGELRIHQAAPSIVALIGTDDAMLDYCIAATLSRIGGPECLAPLDAIARNGNYPDHVRRMADEAKRQVCADADRAKIQDAHIQRLPEELQPLARTGPAEAFTARWAQRFSEADRSAAETIDTLYFIDNEHVRPALLETIRTAALKPNSFRYLRRIFKSAEVRGDWEVFGILAGRFAKEKHEFVMREAWYFHGNRKKPTVGDDAKKAYSKQTRDYLRRRTWRTLDLMGSNGEVEYCKAATEVLLQFDDQDAQPISSYIGYPPPSYSRAVIHCDRFASYWTLGNILFHNSARYTRFREKLRFHCRSNYDPNESHPPPTTREEEYPALWDASPELLLRLMLESRCKPVQEFAGRALIDNTTFCAQIDLQVLIELLGSPYTSTCAFALAAARKKYNPNQPDRELVITMANCTLEEARTQAHSWVEAKRSFFFEDPDFAVAMIISQYSDTRLFARESLRDVRFTSEKAEAIIQQTIDHLLGLGDGESDVVAANEIGGTIARAFATFTQRMDQETIGKLVASPLEGVQLLGGEIILGHQRLSDSPPAEMLHQMFSSEHSSVRLLAVKVVNQLSDSELRRSSDLLYALTRHRERDVRKTVRPTVKRIATSDRYFAKEFADRLIAALLTPGAPEGVPSHTSRVLIDDLGDSMSHVQSSTVWQLLQSRSQPAQDVGGTLLATNVGADSLSVEEMVKLASHDVLSVREASWELCRQSTNRLQKSMASSVRLLDAKWEDSREFGFALFRDQFQSTELSPAVLISICDSVRDDVQQFGCDLITKRFKESDGQEYLIKLSEHPSISLQLFATNYLDRYAADAPERLRELKPYFISVLTRVNKARLSKDRVLALLSREAVKDEGSARIVSQIMSQVSATASIGDRARTIEVMMEIQGQYPDIGQPIEIQTVQVR